MEVTYATIRWSLIKSIDLDIQTDDSEIQLKYDVTKIVLKIRLYLWLVQVSEAEKLEGKSPMDYWRYLQTRRPRSYGRTKWKTRNRLTIGHVKTKMNVNHTLWVKPEPATCTSSSMPDCDRVCEMRTITNIDINTYRYRFLFDILDTTFHMLPIHSFSV